MSLLAMMLLLLLSSFDWSACVRVCIQTLHWHSLYDCAWSLVSVRAHDITPALMHDVHGH